MSRNPMVYLAAAGLGLVLVLLVADAPAHAGALAGLSGPGASAALGVLWVVAFPMMVMCGPPLVLTALVEAWARRRPCSTARTPNPLGLGSRSGPGDTWGQ